MNTSRNVAIVGAFDIDNYGDLLFPGLFRTAMQRRGLDLSLSVFAPHGSQPTMGQDFHVEPLGALASHHDARPFDAIVVGGGALVHTEMLSQHLPNGQFVVNYEISQTWAVPSVFASRTGVPLLWNSPDVPYSFPAASRHLAHWLISQVDHLAVRNKSSRENLEGIGFPASAVSIVPDTAFSLLGMRRDDGNGPLPTKPRRLVVHLNRFIDDEELDRFAKLVSRTCADHNLEVRIIGLARTHDDSAISGALSSLLECEYSVSSALTLTEIMDEISDAVAYVGVSYHGVITALCAGVPAFGFNYMRYGKTKDLYEELGLQRFYGETAMELGSALTAFPSLTDVDRVAVRSFADRVEQHFDELADVIRSGGSSRSEANSGLASLESLVLGLLGASAAVERQKSSVASMEQHLAESSLSVSGTFSGLSVALRELSESVIMSVSQINVALGELARGQSELRDHVLRRLEQLEQASKGQPESSETG